MTSMIFGAIYMGHKGIVEHRREKQRTKNYERWEGLRDEYDEQRKIGRATRSLDIQRTGSGGYFDGSEQDNSFVDERPILTLRDQQEANDARTSWRPQEVFDSHETGAGRRTSATPTGSQHLQQQAFASHRHASTPNGYGITHNHSDQPQRTPPQCAPMSALHPVSTSSIPTIRAQKTGATWDEGLPAPLRVSRRSYEDYDETGRYRGGSVPARTSSLSQPPTYVNGNSNSGPATRSPTPPRAQQYQSDPSTARFYDTVTTNVEPVESHVPGGPMAQLIERGY